MLLRLCGGLLDFFLTGAFFFFLFSELLLPLDDLLLEESLKLLEELDDELDFELLSRSRLAIFALESGFVTDPAGFSGLGFDFSCFSCFSSFSGFSCFSWDFFDGGEELLELLEEFSEEELSDEEEELK